MMGVAAERALRLRLKGGAAWRPPGTQAQVLTPGPPAKPARAGALSLAPGQGLSGLGPPQPNGVGRALWTRLAATYPARPLSRLAGGADPSGRQQAQAGAPGGARPPRCAGRGVPPDWPRANPMARAGGDVPAKGPRPQKRHRRRDVGQDVAQHVHAKGPWQSQLSRL
jgi:hypothetical protein